MNKKALTLIKRSLRLSARGKRHFQEGGDAFEQALALGVPIGEPITLRGVTLGEDRKSLVVVGGKVKTKVVIRDGLRNKDGAEVNSGYTNARFQRFKVEHYKEPKPIGPTPRACGTISPPPEAAL